MNVNILVNTRRTDALEAACETVDWLRQKGIASFAEAEVAGQIGAGVVEPDKLGIADLVISFGGDGTLIRAAGYCSEHGTPVLGVYFGRFGFITQCDPSSLRPVLESFLAGNAQYEDRMMIRADLHRKGQVVVSLHALNEIVLHRDISENMLTFYVGVDGHELTTYPADGILVATPTGSTAYNLSVGGPIVDPRVEAIVLTAIAPHTLSARPLILGATSVVRINVLANGDAVLSCDGHHRLHVLNEDHLIVTRSPRKTRFVSVGSSDFLVKLRKRLFWSKGLLQVDE